MNTAIDTYRKRKRELSLNESIYKDQSNNEYGIEDDYNPYETLSIKDVVSAMQLLSPAYRTVFNLYVMEGMTHKEIANELEISEGTSKSNLAKAKANVKKVQREKLKKNHE
jgi:RNA polymerase sigma-70 factor (ECF subfamily)